MGAEYYSAPMLFFIAITGTTTVANYASVDDLAVNSNSTIGTIGDDILLGDLKNNLIIGNAGNDALTGGAGRDTFSFGVDNR